MLYKIFKKILLFLAPEQVQWQAQELGVLIHFNLATYIDIDGCSGQIVPNASLFKPYLLNTDNWVQTMIDFGAVYAVLVAKVRIILFFFFKILVHFFSFDW
jgi:alpha-L-fucosidase